MPISNPPKPKKTSISIFLLAILPLLYVSFLHTPPSTLLKDTTFWFLISNSIILILAADSGMLFTSTADAGDLLYDEFVVHRNAKVDTAATDNCVVVKEKEVEKSSVVVKERVEVEKRIVVMEKEEEEESEYSKMSDEELNRRVEEFIKRFNREMRLQLRNERVLSSFDKAEEVAV